VWVRGCLEVRGEQSLVVFGWRGAWLGAGSEPSGESGQTGRRGFRVRMECCILCGSVHLVLGGASGVYE
jgi:hypothetical protein